MNRSLIAESLRIGTHQIFSSGNGLYVYDVTVGRFPFLISSHTGNGDIQLRQFMVTQDHVKFRYTNNKVSEPFYGLHKTFVKKTDSVNIFEDIDIVPSIQKTVLVTNPQTGKTVNETILEDIDNSDRLVSSSAIQNELSQYIKQTDPLIEGFQDNSGNVLVWRNDRWVSETFDSTKLTDFNVTKTNGHILKVSGDKIVNESLGNSITNDNKVLSSDVIRSELGNYLHKTTGVPEQYSILQSDGSQWVGSQITWNHLSEVASLPLVEGEDNVLVYSNGKLKTSHILTSYATTSFVTNKLSNYLNTSQGNGDYLHYNGSNWVGETAVKSLADFTEDNYNKLINANAFISYLNNQKLSSIQQTDNLATGNSVVSYVQQELLTFGATYNIAQMNNTFNTVLNIPDNNEQEYVLVKSFDGGNAVRYKNLNDIQNTIKEEIGSGVMNVEVGSGPSVTASAGPVLYYTPNNGIKTAVTNTGIVAYDRTSVDFTDSDSYIIRYDTGNHLFKLQKSGGENLEINSITQKATNSFVLHEGGDIDCKNISCDNINIGSSLDVKDVTCSGRFTSSGTTSFQTIECSGITSSSGSIQQLEVNDITITGSSTFQQVTSNTLTLNTINCVTIDATQSVSSTAYSMSSNGNISSISSSGNLTNLPLVFFDGTELPSIQSVDYRIRDGDLTILNNNRELENLNKVTTTEVVSTTISNSGTIDTDSISTQTLLCSGSGTFSSVSCTNLNFNVSRELVTNISGVLAITYNNSILQTAGIQDSSTNLIISAINFTGGIPENGFQFFLFYQRDGDAAGINVEKLNFTIQEAGNTVNTFTNIPNDIIIQAGQTYLIEGKKLSIGGGINDTYFIDFKQYYST